MSIDAFKLNISLHDSASYLGIDTGTGKNTLGYAVVQNNTVLEYGCLNGSEFQEVSQSLSDIARKYDVRLVLIEDYIYMQYLSYHTMFANAKKAHMLIGYLSAVFDQQNIPYTVISPKKWKDVLKKYYTLYGYESDTASNWVKDCILPESERKKLVKKAELQKNSHWIEAIGIVLSKSLTSELSILDKNEELKKQQLVEFRKFLKLSKSTLKLFDSMQTKLLKLQKVI